MVDYRGKLVQQTFYLYFLKGVEKKRTGKGDEKMPMEGREKAEKKSAKNPMRRYEKPAKSGRISIN